MKSKLMPEIMPFGKKRDKSVEQILLQDYVYFDWIMNNIDIRKYSLRERFNYVRHVANNFVSLLPCRRCDNPAKYISVYTSHIPHETDSRTSDSTFIYDSMDCFKADGRVAPKGRLKLLKFDTALSSTKFDTNQLVKVLTQCMGMRQGRRSKEYLEEFFDEFREEGKLWVPYR